MKSDFNLILDKEGNPKRLVFFFQEHSMSQSQNMKGKQDS